MVELAVATGIPPAVWADEGEQAIVTALHVLQRATSRHKAGPQMSG